MSIQAVIFDWAGTTVDHGCMAPVGVFVELFKKRGVEVTIAQAREPMGTHKREHIRRMCSMPKIAEAWAAAHGAPPGDEDVDAMYAEATPLQISALPHHSKPITGVPQTVEWLRERGIRIGSTTGYNTQMLDVVKEAAAKEGFSPDVAVAADQVTHGRPAPYMCWTAAMRLSVWPASACVKVGDTPVDVQAGRVAGMWSVGVAATGNEVGLSEAELAAHPNAQALVEAARAKLMAAGAHLVIDSVAQMQEALQTLEARLQQGERP